MEPKIIHSSCLSLKIPDVKERHPRYTVGKTLSSNLVFTIWTVFGGFILHFLLSNFLTVLLRPSYEEPVDSAADILNRGIIPLLWPGADIWKHHFADSPDPNYQEISRRFHVAKDWDEYTDMVRKVTSTGLYAEMQTHPAPWAVSEAEYKHWYRSTETVPGDNPYSGHLTNKKWPLKKVF